MKQFYILSILMVVLLIGSGFVVYPSLQAKNRLLTQSQEQADKDRQVQSELEIANQFFARTNQTAQAAIPKLVPGPLELPLFYDWLEERAQRQQLTVKYNFQPAGAAARGVKTPDQPGLWLISVDFLGTVAAAETMLGDLEQSPYHLSIQYAQFDLADPTESQLSVELYLYGRRS